MDDNDIVLRLVEILEREKTFANSNNFTINLANLYVEDGFDPVDVRRVVDAAAKLVNLQVARRGQDMIRFESYSPPVTFRNPEFD